MSAAWTLPGDVVEKAGTVWRRGTPLSAEATTGTYPGLRMPLKGPSAVERAARYDELRLWLDTWRTAPRVIRVEWKPVNDRVLGRVLLPVAAHLDTVDLIAKSLGPGAVCDLAVFRANVRATPEAFRSYVAQRPWRVVEIGADWPAVVSATEWLVQNPDSGLHARQIPAEGVHTKIVERYRRDIAAMVPVATESAAESGTTSFSARFGLTSKPARIRMRFLDPSLRGAGPWSDVETPVAEADGYPIDAAAVLFVENEVSFLALPELAGTVAIFGGGRAAASLVDQVGWLAKAPVIRYWGDIDTWGFVILDELRKAVAGRAVVESLLMDSETLLAHRAAWVRDERPTNARCEHLSEAEGETYNALVTNQHGPQVRLEQERIPWPSVLRALDSSPDRSGPAEPLRS